MAGLVDDVAEEVVVEGELFGNRFLGVLLIGGLHRVDFVEAHALHFHTIVQLGEIHHGHSFHCVIAAIEVPGIVDVSENRTEVHLFHNYCVNHMDEELRGKQTHRHVRKTHLALKHVEFVQILQVSQVFDPVADSQVAVVLVIQEVNPFINAFFRVIGKGVQCNPMFLVNHSLIQVTLIGSDSDVLDYEILIRASTRVRECNRLQSIVGGDEDIAVTLAICEKPETPKCLAVALILLEVNEEPGIECLLEVVELPQVLFGARQLLHAVQRSPLEAEFVGVDDHRNG